MRVEVTHGRQAGGEQIEGWMGQTREGVGMASTAFLYEKAYGVSCVVLATGIDVRTWLEGISCLYQPYSVYIYGWVSQVISKNIL